MITPAPSLKHQVILTQILTVLMNSCQPDYVIFASPIDLILSNTEVRQPDLVMVPRSKMDIITSRGIEGTPSLVGEILSPHSIKRDRFNKLKVYAQYHILEYWIIDPANEVFEQYVLAENEYQLFYVYGRGDTVQSEQLKCVSFTIDQPMNYLIKSSCF
ncbi:Uma2 family endonuclease [Pueribacillus theae]|uniref:Uma2 family endonuclease n=1 Tax=Pueribacillus theae TaxID=2171751 RepID=A0A2U1JXN6_9BACI|nr:Uma2 family endonuclease [Pueribacillus theae]